MTLTVREFVGEDYYKSQVKTYEENKRFLNTCGKPKDKYDEALIDIAKHLCKVTRRYALNN
jgi:hypothetical protein